MVDNPTEADKAEEADEADKADNTNEAIDTKKAEAYEADTFEAEDSVADEAEARVAKDKGKITKIGKADETNLTDDADATDKAITTFDIKLDNLDEVDKANEIIEAAEVDNSDKAIESDNANEVNEAIALDKANDVDELETNKADLSIETNKFDWIDEIGAANYSIMINKVVLGLLALFECDQGSTCSLRN